MLLIELISISKMGVSLIETCFCSRLYGIYFWFSLILCVYLTRKTCGQHWFISLNIWDTLIHLAISCCVVWVFDFVVDFVFCVLVCIKHESYILTLRIRGFMNLRHHIYKQLPERDISITYYNPSQMNRTGFFSIFTRFVHK